MFALEPWIWIVIAVVNIPLYLFLIWVIFDDLAGFVEALKYAIKPDLLSMIQGEWDKDWTAELKLLAFTAASTGAVIGEGWLLAHHILGTI